MMERKMNIRYYTNKYINKLRRKIEVINKKNSITPKLSVIVLFVNTICNAKCFFCDIGESNRNINIDERKGLDLLRNSKEKFLSLEFLNKILQDPYVRKRKPSFKLLMTEPLLSHNIFDIVRAIKAGNYSVSLQTNGFLLQKKAQGLVEAGLDKIQVSIDGPLEINDYIRGEGFYSNALEGIKRINRISNMPVAINYTISNLNYDCILKFLNNLANEKVIINLLKFQFMDFVSDKIKLKQNNNFKIKMPSISTLSDVVNLKIDPLILQNELQNVKKISLPNIKKIDIIPSIISADIISAYFNEEGPPLFNNEKCTIPFSRMVLKPDGDAYFNLRCFNYKIGNAKRSNIESIFLGESANYFRKEFLKNNMRFPACARCCGLFRKSF